MLKRGWELIRFAVFAIMPMKSKPLKIHEGYEFKIWLAQIVFAYCHLIVSIPSPPPISCPKLRWKVSMLLLKSQVGVLLKLCDCELFLFLIEIWLNALNVKSGTIECVRRFQREFLWIQMPNGYVNFVKTIIELFTLIRIKLLNHTYGVL